MLRIAPMRSAGHHDRRNLPQPFDNVSCFVKSSHMSVAGCKKAICRRPARSFLQGKKQHCFGLLKSLGEKMPNAYSEVSPSSCRAFAWAEAHGSLEVLDRQIGLPRPQSDPAAPLPSLSEARVKFQRTIDQRCGRCDI